MASVNVTESILDSIKTYCGIVPEYDAFDATILMLINSAFSTLEQLGIDISDNFVVEDNSTTWDEIGYGKRVLSFIIQYVQIYTRLNFDPPQNSFAGQMAQKQLDELVWRINVQAEKMKRDSAAG